MKTPTHYGREQLKRGQLKYTVSIIIGACFLSAVLSKGSTTSIARLHRHYRSASDKATSDRDRWVEVRKEAKGACQPQTQLVHVQNVEFYVAVKLCACNACEPDHTCQPSVMGTINKTVMVEDDDYNISYKNVTLQTHEKCQCRYDMKTQCNHMKRLREGKCLTVMPNTSLYLNTIHFTSTYTGPAYLY